MSVYNPQLGDIKPTYRGYNPGYYPLTKYPEPLSNLPLPKLMSPSQQGIGQHLLKGVLEDF